MLKFEYVLRNATSGIVHAVCTTLSDGLSSSPLGALHGVCCTSCSHCDIVHGSGMVNAFKIEFFADSSLANRIDELMRMHFGPVILTSCTYKLTSSG